MVDGNHITVVALGQVFDEERRLFHISPRIGHAIPVGGRSNTTELHAGPGATIWGIGDALTSV